jgi:TRAP-type transport system periplasmic protein
MRARILLAPLLCISLAVSAEEGVTTLRMATVAPDGSLLARELKRLADEVDTLTSGHVRMKWYFNGVAGDELEQGDRMMRGQLDGSASGQMFCNRIAPSMRVTRLPGVFQDRDEATDAINRLQPELMQEAHEHGFVLLTTVSLGPDIIFTREPVHSFAELKRVKLWRWDLDEVGIATSREMGLQIVPLPVAEGARAYDQRRSDGFLAIPLAALAFQWSSRAHYITDLRGSYIWSCLIMTERAVNHLSAPNQKALREAAARGRERFEETARRADDQLLNGGLFTKQGAVAVPVSETFRAEYLSAARNAREKVASRFVPAELVSRVMQMLADYRLEHRKQ